MRFRLLVLPLLILAVVAAPLAMSRGGGEDVARLAVAEALEEEREMLEPSTAMLARQFSGGAVDPVAAFAQAREEAIGLGAETAREAPAVAAADWELVGPANIGGRVLDVVIDPQDSDTVYAATASGGVFKSTDGGVRFEPAWPHDETQPIGALAIAPDGTLWAGTGESGPGGGSLTYGGRGVFRSSNGGKTWKHVGLERSARIGRVVIDPADPDRVWVAASGNLFVPGGQRGLYRTDDGGKNWTRVFAGANPTTGAVDVAVDPKNPQNVFAAMWDHKRGPNEHVYYGLGSGLFRSTDGGETWTRTGGPTLAQSPSLGRIGVAIAWSDPNTIYAIAQYQSGRQAGLLKSTDGGANWTFLPSSTLLSAGSSFAWWFGRIYVDPDDAGHLFVAGVTLPRSTDGGMSFSNVGGVHADQHGMAWDPNNDDVVYLGNDGGVYRSDNNGRNWTFAEYQPWSQLYSVDVSEQDPERRQVAGLQDNSVNRSWGANEPDQWDTYGSGDGLRALIKPDDQNIVYGCAQYGSCFVDRSGGDGAARESISQEVVSLRKNWFTPIEFDPEDSRTVYSGGEMMSRSSDDGSNWTRISGDLSNGPQPDPDPDYRSFGTLTTIGPAGKSTGYIYAGTDDGNVWVTKDNGANWTKSTDSDLPKAWVTRVQADPDDERTAYLTYSGFRSGTEKAYVFKTTDGGANWTDITGDLPGAPVNDINIAGGMLVVASDVGVYAAEDDGGKWRRVGKGLPLAPVHELRYIEQTGELFVATFGRSMWKIALPDAGDLE